MAGIPADYGGDRVLIDDPEKANAAQAAGDQAALQLQLLHILEPVIQAHGLVAERNRLAEGFRNIRRAADQHNARESNTRALAPMSRIPVDWGAVDNLVGVRINQHPQMEQEPRDSRDICRWLDRMVNASVSHGLTEQATISLLVSCSKGPISDHIEELRVEGKSYADIVRNLELRYGDLCPPKEAVLKVNALQRRPSEPLSSFIDRLKYLARMAKRHIADDDERRLQITSLLESNVRRALAPSVREALDDRDLTRMRMGLPPFTLTELEKEITELERRREERHLQQRRGHQGPGRIATVQAAHPHRVNQVYLQANLSDNTGYDSPYGDSFSDLEPEETDGVYLAPEMQDEGVIALVHNINYVQDKYQARGAVAPPNKVWNKAVNRTMRYAGQAPPRDQQRANPGYRGNRQPQNERPQARQVTAQQGYQPQPGYQPRQGYQPPLHGEGQYQPRPQGPPNRLPDGRFTVRDLLNKANCVAGECIRCGRVGHVMNSDICPLRGKPLQDKACVGCKKGLHAVNDCMMAYQPPAQGQVNQVQAEWSDDSDDLNLS